jgi:hypothetical protein
MPGTFIKSRTLFRVLITLLFSLSFITVSSLDSYAQCPVPLHRGWAQHSTVRFFIGAGLNDEHKRQIRAATGEWNRANTVNNSRVHFVEDPTGQNYSLLFVADALPQGNPATFKGTYNAGPPITAISATITYDPNNTFPGTGTLIADPTQPGYSTIVMKLILHEMGHLMGLDHPADAPCAQLDNGSVLNYACGINDQGNKIPTMVSACDQTTINSETIYPAIQEPTNRTDDNYFFIRQQYLDFLDREPDAEGFNYWTTILNGCGTDLTCLNRVRVEISSRFFIELEFQQTGFFVIRLWQAAYGRFPTFAEFMVDRRQVENTNQSRAAFAASFVQRPAFTAIYGALSNADYVNRLFDTAQLFPYTTERQTEITALNGGKTRAQVLQSVAEIQEFRNRHYNPSFVRMQYYGYLRRDAEAGGEAYWNDVLTIHSPNNYQSMICAFVNSAEYHFRFHNTRGMFDELDCAW